MGFDEKIKTVRTGDRNRNVRLLKPMAETGYAVAAFEGPFLLLIIARPQAEALTKRVGNDREKLNTAGSETKEVVARWTADNAVSSLSMV
ncbi:hypothetical protein [Mesorhizobium sp. M0145]|uniref:hypothetical protein n=1 Tax=unclassified Mesorhizobium TaxID=325217 RepID=UPI0033360E5D